MVSMVYERLVFKEYLNLSNLFIQQLSHTHERPALICLNDDVAKGARGGNRIQDLLQDWYDETFAQQLPYETDYGNPMDAWI